MEKDSLSPKSNEALPADASQGKEAIVDLSSAARETDAGSLPPETSIASPEVLGQKDVYKITGENRKTPSPVILSPKDQSENTEASSVTPGQGEKRDDDEGKEENIIGDNTVTSTAKKDVGKVFMVNGDAERAKDAAIITTSGASGVATDDELLSVENNIACASKNLSDKDDDDVVLIVEKIEPEEKTSGDDDRKNVSSPSAEEKMEKLAMDVEKYIVASMDDLIEPAVKKEIADPARSGAQDGGYGAIIKDDGEVVENFTIGARPYSCGESVAARESSEQESHQAGNSKKEKEELCDNIIDSMQINGSPGVEAEIAEITGGRIIGSTEQSDQPEQSEPDLDEGVTQIVKNTERIKDAVEKNLLNGDKAEIGNIVIDDNDSTEKSKDASQNLSEDAKSHDEVVGSVDQGISQEVDSQKEGSGQLTGTDEDVSLLQKEEIKTEIEIHSSVITSEVSVTSSLVEEMKVSEEVDADCNGTTVTVQREMIEQVESSSCVTKETTQAALVATSEDVGAETDDLVCETAKQETMMETVGEKTEENVSAAEPVADETSSELEASSLAKKTNASEDTNESVEIETCKQDDISENDEIIKETKEIVSDVQNVKVEMNKQSEKSDSVSIVEETETIECDVQRIEEKISQKFEKSENVSIVEETKEIGSEVHRVEMEMSEQSEKYESALIVEKTQEVDGDIQRVEVESKQSLESESLSVMTVKKCEYGSSTKESKEVETNEETSAIETSVTEISSSEVVEHHYEESQALVLTETRNSSDTNAVAAIGEQTQQAVKTADSEEASDSTKKKIATAPRSGGRVSRRRSPTKPSSSRRRISRPGKLDSQGGGARVV
ncbi:hypothetical protein HAZT_HAZT002662 [Hyalella azteca]|uniref:Uncharacterized protein n=1 Tax=Hyalella azteca TaxID=294128 RepID=A0A6A0GPS0_HYAAZ|nr:hypothetical protein HAZT_HAZT002662 [Hyalella azteca]